ncbi:glycosyltransferase family 2 protein [Bacteroides stercorirosoris]|uniref:glycosyltransferase family 2 protein n=1 Tax=Bacteroides stercorirosoris TaxID=871324 RepID=UPI0023F9F579|nr:glycosyltransferase family 2 protein [Bacteroides stercorirosoris]
MVSIITVNYNGLADTCEMIASFRKYETYPYEIIVVDNGSQNPEADEIKMRHPAVKVVQNTNTGFAGGNNAGLRVAEGNYLFFLNNDTIIKGPILKTLVHRLEAAPENGGASPMLKYSYAPDTLQYAGFTPFSRITLRNAAIGFNEKDQPRYRIACETASLHGAAMMVRRDVLQRVGPMTEIYFLFYEEFDWSAQLHRAGYKLWYEPEAVVYHKESMTAKKGTPLREFYLSRARVLYARRNIPGSERILSCLYITFIAAPKKTVAYLLRGKFRLAVAVIRGTFYGLISSKQ